MAEPGAFAVGDRSGARTGPSRARTGEADSIAGAGRIGLAAMLLTAGACNPFDWFFPSDPLAHCPFKIGQETSEETGQTEIEVTNKFPGLRAIVLRLDGKQSSSAPLLIRDDAVGVEEIDLSWIDGLEPEATLTLPMQPTPLEIRHLLPPHGEPGAVLWVQLIFEEGSRATYELGELRWKTVLYECPARASDPPRPDNLDRPDRAEEEEPCN
jgi:hypothetical protein